MFDPFGTAAGRFAEPTQGRPHPIHPGWPESTPSVLLPPSEALAEGGEVRLRPLLRKDGADWRQQRIADEEFLRPVEPTMPTTWRDSHNQQAWWSHLTQLRSAAREGIVVPCVIELDGRFVGQLTLGNIQHGGIAECWIGYWVYSQVHKAGVATAACGLGVDHAFSRMGLHRVTATFMPENPGSRKVLVANGFRREGYLRRALHINGAWRDHHLMAIVRDDYRSTAVERLREQGRIR